MKTAIIGLKMNASDSKIEGMINSFYKEHDKIIEGMQYVELKDGVVGLDELLISIQNKDSNLNRIQNESELCDRILNNAQLLTCYNCGEKLAEAYSAGVTGDKVGVLHIDPGSSNYPVAPDEPAVAYFECLKCAQKDKNLLIKVIKSKNLNEIQADLLSSFLIGHWKEISKGEHKVAFELILDILNPGALQLVKKLAGE